MLILHKVGGGQWTFYYGEPEGPGRSLYDLPDYLPYGVRLKLEDGTVFIYPWSTIAFVEDNLT